MPDVLEPGDFEEIPEDNIDVLSLTDPNLEQSLQIAARVGERGVHSGARSSLRSFWAAASCLCLPSTHPGTPVLLLDFEKRIPWCPALQQLVQKEALQGAKTSQEMSVSPSFQLYLCAQVPLEALATGKRGKLPSRTSRQCTVHILNGVRKTGTPWWYFGNECKHEIHSFKTRFLSASSAKTAIKKEQKELAFIYPMYLSNVYPAPSPCKETRFKPSKCHDPKLHFKIRLFVLF